MASPRLERILAVVSTQADGGLPDRMCSAGAQLLASPGVGIDLALDRAMQPVAATAAAEVGERLQADLGEGPCYDAARSGRPVLVSALETDRSWPTFGPAAYEAGVRATFSFPLRSGEVRLGSLNLYRSEEGDLSDEQHADALALARLVTDLLVSLQSDAPSRQLPELLGFAQGAGWQIHQATGMVAAQLDVSVADALARLRGHAFTTGRPVGEVAAAVVDRRLRLDGDS